MPSCECGFEYNEGTVVCWQCGDLLTESSVPVQSHTSCVLVCGKKQEIDPFKPALILHLISCFEVTFQEGEETITIPLDVLSTPVRIGRRDENQDPPIIPEVDLTPLLERHWDQRFRPPISRLHAALQMENGKPAIKHLVERTSKTWVRHSGDRRKHLLPLNLPLILKDRDVLYLGHQDFGLIKMRVCLL
ncbi:MAG: hypothetical protein UT30_C0005G0023 [Candidatus Uhrbacteria bacterium GW2011_GWF2_39_13]|uniref:FHA domain-containing protein n=1 Tax=Candidatus Uhrbacteria bacterium GW2011_GWF2_39_13 TaxID=1618995 RepID=A0A0G0Q2I9_9BACT|nr:MAG: hypothetical protein UT30_C0005G0023 [Candidatus Uhrbacteria bacterium GW2011_GWF2_39_13]HAU66456.1 hypothetical protein [Candidatus Uhrbacteria bacterium]